MYVRVNVCPCLDACHLSGRPWTEHGCASRTHGMHVQTSPRMVRSLCRRACDFLGSAGDEISSSRVGPADRGRTSPAAAPPFLPFCPPVLCCVPVFSLQIYANLIPFFSGPHMLPSQQIQHVTPNIAAPPRYHAITSPLLLPQDSSTGKPMSIDVIISRSSNSFDRIPGIAAEF